MSRATQRRRSFNHDWCFKLFELAVAVAIVLYGFDSGAALATVVGVLIEVPVMLWLVKLVNQSRPWYEDKIRRKA